MTTTTATWHWQDHWNPAPPASWNGNHEFSVRGHWQNCDAAGVTLTCSCGRETDAAMPPDSGEDGMISLAALNELAAAHLADDGDSGP